MSEEKVLFQSENNVEIVGKLVSMEIKDLTTKTDKTPMKMGTVRVRTAEGETHTVNVMAMKYFKNNPKEENKQYKAIQTMEEKYITEEETLNENGEHFGEAATNVIVRGNFQPNVYKNKAGETIENLRLQGRYISGSNNVTEKDFKATVVLSGYIEAEPIEEMKNDEGTGRYIFKLRVVDYQNKAFPIEIVAGDVIDDDGDTVEAGEWIAENYEKGQTVTIGADIINRFIVKETARKRGGIGKKIVDTSKDIQREYRLYSAEDPLDYNDYDEDEVEDVKQVVFPSQIKESFKNYETFVADQLAAAEKRKSEKDSDSDETKTAKRGAMGGGAAKKKASGKSKVSQDDLPF